jgi:polygalacturonase
MPKILTTILVLTAAFASARLYGQDTRIVTEPVIPPSCTVLHADKIGVAEKLDAQYEASTDTARIQSALDHCAAGQAVRLSLGTTCHTKVCARNLTTNAFLTGSLELREGVTLLIDKGVTLYGSRDPKDYDPNPSDTATKLLCGTMSDVSRVYITTNGAAATTAKDAAAGKTMPSAPTGRTCKSLISINVKNAAIMGEGTIDGRGGAVVLGHDYTWWQMARAAEPKQLAYYTTRLITASHADGLILYGIHLNNAPNCHVCVNNTDGFTAWGVHLQTPTVKGTDARNTDGIDPGSSTNVTVANSWIDNGDDNIAIKANVQHMSVLNNHFYDGHGMSIGSEVSGDANLLVNGLTEDHTTSGIRIKSNNAKGGPVHDLTFINICMTGVKIPIAISPYYNNGTVEGYTDPGVVGEHIPDYKNITLENIYDESPGDVLIAGKDADHITEVTLRNVTIKGIQPAQVHLNYADIKVLVPWSNIPLGTAAKDNKTVTMMVAGGNDTEPIGGKPDTCAARFVPYQ